MNWPEIVIDHIELREVKLPLVHPFETSFGRTLHRQAILVLATGGGITGYGECTAQPAPVYSYESNVTAWHVLEDFLAPAILGKPVGRPEEIGALLRFVRGHPMAKSALEAAIHDLAARCLGVSLSSLLGGVRAKVPVGISLGIEPTIEDLVAQVDRAVAHGYGRVKLKIKPGWDVEPLRAVRRAFPDLRLTADANAAYTLEHAGHLAGLDALGLEMLEQPLDHDDLFDHAALAATIRTPVCLDESITGPEAARHALRIGACRIINIKMGRVGGPVRARAVHDEAQRAGAPVWCGGMLETGIGRCHNLALASLPNFRLPGDLSESRRYFEEDIVDPPAVFSEPGFIDVPSGPGLGAAVRMDRVEKITLRARRIGP